MRFAFPVRERTIMTSWVVHAAPIAPAPEQNETDEAKSLDKKRIGVLGVGFLGMIVFVLVLPGCSPIGGRCYGNATCTGEGMCDGTATCEGEGICHGYGGCETGDDGLGTCQGSGLCTGTGECSEAGLCNGEPLAESETCEGVLECEGLMECSEGVLECDGFGSCSEKSILGSCDGQGSCNGYANCIGYGQCSGPAFCARLGVPF